MIKAGARGSRTSRPLPRGPDGVADGGGGIYGGE